MGRASDNKVPQISVVQTEKKTYCYFLLLLLSLDPHIGALLCSMCLHLQHFDWNSADSCSFKETQHIQERDCNLENQGLHMHYTRTRILDTHRRLVTFVVTDKKAKLFPLIIHIKFSFYATLLLTSITRTKPEKESICATKVRKTADYGKLYLSQIHNH